MNSEKINKFYSLGQDNDLEFTSSKFPYDPITQTISHKSNHMERAALSPEETRTADEEDIREWLTKAGIKILRVEVNNLTTTVYLDPASLA